MITTLMAEEDPVLDCPPNPAKPPQSSASDRELALMWKMGGATADGMTAYFTALADRARESARFPVADPVLAVILSGHAAEIADGRARLLAAMAELEAEGQTPETARTALGMTAATVAA